MSGQRVAVIGVGQTAHKTARKDVSMAGLVREAAQEALDGVQKVVSETVADMRQAGEQVPVPLADQQFSGRFNVRVPPSLHRILVTEATREGVSLNRHVSDLLARR